MPGISAVAERQALPIWLVLGHALVHEAGHALLGPGHSQGVMRPDFRKTDWRQAEKGQLLFVANDAHRIREGLVKVAECEGVGEDSPQMKGHRTAARHRQLTWSEDGSEWNLPHFLDVFRRYRELSLGVW